MAKKRVTPQKPKNDLEQLKIWDKLIKRAADIESLAKDERFKIIEAALVDMRDELLSEVLKGSNSTESVYTRIGMARFANYFFNYLQVLVHEGERALQSKKAHFDNVVADAEAEVSAEEIIRSHSVGGGM